MNSDSLEDERQNAEEEAGLSTVPGLPVRQQRCVQVPRHGGGMSVQIAHILRDVVSLLPVHIGVAVIGRCFCNQTCCELI